MNFIVNAVKRCAEAAVFVAKRAVQVTVGLLRTPVVAASTGALVLAGNARAAATTLDVTDVIATITAAVTTISSIGIAVLSLVVVIKLFSWAKRALGG